MRDVYAYRRWSVRLCSVIVLFGGSLLNGCGGGSSTPLPPPLRQLVSVSVQPSAASAVQGGTSFFTATGTYDQAPTTQTNLPAQWASSDTNVATIDASTGVATCVSAGGPVTITASDAGKGGTVKGTAALTCNPPPPPLAITSPSPIAGVAGVTYGQLHTVPTPAGPRTLRFFQLTASGGTGSYSWSWTAVQGSTLPPGLTCCNPVFGLPSFPFPVPRGVVVHGAIAGRPTAVGDFHVSVTVADNGTPPKQTSKNYDIHIAPPPPPVINTTPGPAIGTLNSPYLGFTFTASGGFGALTWSETGALPRGMTLNGSGLLAGTPTSAGSFPVTLIAEDSVGQNSPPQDFTIQVLSQGFVPTANMTSPRLAHTATLLADGKVLIAGGADSNGDLKTAELFDPVAKTFAATGSMSAARQAHTATRLANGKILVSGGFRVGARFPVQKFSIQEPGHSQSLAT